jgi:hypothetical protein
MRVTKIIGIILLVINIFGCHSTKLPINVSEDVLLLKNRNVLKNYFNNNRISNGELFDIEKQRYNIINSLSSNELESDTLIIYETLFSHISASYNCVVYNSRLKSIKFFSEKSKERLTKDGIRLDTINTPPKIYICLVNTIREKGVYKWNKLRFPNIGSTRYSLLTIAIKNPDRVYELTSYVDIYPPLDCE